MTALFFDLDDTIISHDAVADIAWDDTFDAFAGRLGPHSKEHVKKTMIDCSAAFWSHPVQHMRGRLNLREARRTIIRAAFDRLKINDNDLAINYADHFFDLREKLITPFPEAIETLQTFRDRGIPMALITNGAKETQYHKIERFNLRPYFKEIVVEGEFGFGKPRPEGFLHALKSLKAAPAETWMIGDSLEFDVAGAKPLGIRTAWNNWSRKPLPQAAPAFPDIEINSIKELLEIEL